jgi:hypothetical protein
MIVKTRLEYCHLGDEGDQRLTPIWLMIQADQSGRMNSTRSGLYRRLRLGCRGAFFRFLQ